MYKTYLEESDLREEEHFPMIALLNEAASDDLLEFLGNLCKGIGIGYDYSIVTFGMNWTSMIRVRCRNLMEFVWRQKMVNLYY